MLLRENDLGWCLYNSRHWFTIRRAHPPLCSRLWQVGPAFVNLLLAAAIWMGRDRAMWYILSAFTALFLWVWLAGSNKAKRLVWSALLPAVVFFVGLLGRKDISANAVLYAVPFVLLFGLLVFRPTVLCVNVRSRVLGGLIPHVPFGRVNIELGQDPESGRYQVYLEDLQPLWETPTHTGIWKCLVWESSTEAEASALAEEFHAWGIGTPDPRMEVQVVKGDRRLRLWAYGGHILSVVALIALILWVGRSRGRGLIDAEAIVLLRTVQIIVAFLFLSVLPLATYLFRLGRGVIRCRQMPPPGMRIISSMKLIEGDKAVTRGRTMAVIGFVLIVIGLVGGLYVPYKLGSLYGEPLRSATRHVSSHK